MTGWCGWNRKREEMSKVVSFVEDQKREVENGKCVNGMRLFLVEWVGLCET